MKIFFIIISIIALCVSCGIKKKPEYESQIQYNKNII